MGTELLLGEIVNTNAAYLSRGLAELGIPLYHQTVVGDNADRLACALRDALSRADLIVMTGGLGPTCDDLTKETVAEAFGLPLVFHAESFHRIEKLLGKSACALTENQKKQAMVPEGAEIFENDYGTAPGIAVEDGQTGAVAVLLPGPPGEMAPMFENQVRPFLLARSGKRLVSHNLHLIGIGEARAEEILRTLMLSSENPTVAPYAKDGEVRLRVTAMAETVESCEALCGKKIEEIRRSEVGPFIYGTDCGSLQAAVVDRAEDCRQNGSHSGILYRRLSIQTADRHPGRIIRVCGQRRSLREPRKGSAARRQGGNTRVLRCGFARGRVRNG